MTTTKMAWENGRANAFSGPNESNKREQYTTPELLDAWDRGHFYGAQEKLDHAEDHEQRGLSTLDFPNERAR